MGSSGLGVQARSPRTLLFGLGNPIMRDDAIGLIVARRVAAAIGSEQADLVEAAVAGLDVVDVMAGYDKVVVIDAITTRNGKVGQLFWLRPDDELSTSRLSADHDMTLGESLALGRRLGLPLPEEVVICAVEARDTHTFGEGLTEELALCVPQIVAAIVGSQFRYGQVAGEWRPG